MFLGKRLDEAKASKAAQLAALEDELLDKVSEDAKARAEEAKARAVVSRISEEMRVLLSRRLRLRKEAGLLTAKEKKMFSDELGAIDELIRLEEQAGVTASDGSPRSYEEGPTGQDLNPGWGGFPLDYLEDFPPDLSYAQLTGREGGGVS
jgi:hypothetical protein